MLRAPGRPLDAATRSFMEPRFGHDFSGVRVHTDARAAESARAVGALAYTVGRDLVFGAGQYVPGSRSGQRLLAHELTHVVQQRASGGSGELHIDLDRHSALEREAAGAADRVAAGERAGVVGVARGRLQRQLVNEPAGGCGVCKDPTLVGQDAHRLIERAFHQIYPSVTTETGIYSPTDDDNGRLDLLRITWSPTPPFLTSIEIGEIKPNNPKGIRDGARDLADYKAMVGAFSPGPHVSVDFLRLPPPALPLAFQDTTAPACPEQALMIGGTMGLYLYSCTPPRSEIPKDCCRARPPVPVPKPATEEERQKETQRQTPAPAPGGGLVPAPAGRSPLEEITRFIRQLIETGEDVEAAARRFLSAHPELVNYLIGAAVTAIVATIVEDIATAGAGLADDPVIIAICYRIISVARAIRAAPAAAAASPI
ncbi:MAG TPA: DUF4157 domain-containing protein [Thermomicrobiales bacterium]|nr:DUF4157 domain-containing protein [Thermomicrobiales bacterium]